MKLADALGIAAVFGIVVLIYFIAQLWLAVFSPAGATPSEKILLVLTYSMPDRVPDVRLVLPQPDLATCWSEAKRFVDAGITPKLPDAIGVMGACMSNAKADDL